MIKMYSNVDVEIKEEDLNKQNVIYCLTFENGKTYIGQTTKQLHIRISQHCYITNSCTKLKRAIQKYKSFTVSILESNLNISQLNSFEKFYIKLLNSNGIDGYNLDSGGTNKTLSAETRSKMSESQKGRHKGKTHSAETRSKMSESQKGKTLSDETRSKMSESQKGKHKGKTHSDETKNKMSESKKGKTLSDVHKRKMSESQKRKVKSIPDNIIFDSVIECGIYYNISKLSRYYNSKIHSRSGQTFVLIME